MNNTYQKIKRMIPLGIISLALFAGCYPKGPEYYSDLDLTATDYDPEYKFEDQKLFWIADTVHYITNQDDDELDDATQLALINKFVEKLEERNYSRVPVSEPDQAEFVLAINVTSIRNSGVGWIPGPPCYPNWWGCYPGYYPPYWGGYYTFSYNTGSVIANWYDPQEEPVQLPELGGETQPIHWVSAFNGLVSSSANNNAARISAGIDQAFSQSPYIQSNK